MKPTLEELSQWSNTHLTIKCAELLDWENVCIKTDNGKQWVSGQPPLKWAAHFGDKVPDFPGCLDACQQFETGLNPEQGLEYHLNLQTLVQQWMTKNEDRQGWLKFYTTTAPAIMRTIAYIYTAWK